MRWTITTNPASEPIDNDDVRLHLRQDGDVTVDDSLVNAIIPAARAAVEAYTGQCLVTQTWKTYLDAEELDAPWPGYDGAGAMTIDDLVSRRQADRRIFLPKSPLISVSLINVYDEDGDATAVSSDIYYTSSNGPRPFVALKYAQTWPWPDSRRQYDTLEIVATYGYGATPSAISDGVYVQLAEGVKMMASYMYVNRGWQVLGNDLQALTSYLPPEIKAMLAPHRVVSL